MPEYPPYPHEQPLYTLSQNKTRAIVPIMLSLFILSATFYFGVLLNISLLELTVQQETTAKTVALIAVVLLIPLGIGTSIRNAHKPYLFYRTHIQWKQKSVSYPDINSTVPVRNTIDRLFHTYSIKLSPRFQLHHIPDTIQLQQYLEQWRQFAQRQARLQTSQSIPQRFSSQT